MVKHFEVQQWKKYKVSGDSVTRDAKDCPRCGPGTLLAQHKNRTSCGKCGFSEIHLKK